MSLLKDNADVLAPFINWSVSDAVQFNAAYRVNQIKRGQLYFLLVTVECIYKI